MQSSSARIIRHLLAPLVLLALAALIVARSSRAALLITSCDMDSGQNR